ncbi:hypothetical protein ACFOPX_06350 [Helicobacter baculiformis]|uniref:Uncharacterized protein n=1 Tax=Helicobacter baculiformis TaxID=427351 RepID=A0ABV7ZHU7_9HELI|nr:hypothetical protein [Helicobacter baculiformis]
MLALSGCADAYVLEGSGSGVHVGFYRLPSVALKGAPPKQASLFDTILDVLVSGKVTPTLKNITTYEAHSMHLGQYEDFVSKCQKHVKIELPQMGSHVSASSAGPYHVNFHWKF